MLAECSLSVLTGDADLPKKVAMIRKTGMVIYQRGYLRSLVPFCGVFLCRNDEGNRILREMEPPRHDIWDPDHPERGMNKKVEAEYMAFIRRCIKQLISVDESKVISIPDLNRFLPDDDDSDETTFDGNESATKEETPDRSPLPEKIPGRKVDPRQRQMQPDNARPEEEQEETESRDGEGSGGGPGESTSETTGGGGSGGGGRGQGNAGPEAGGKGGAHSKPAVPVRYRTFATAPERGIYTLVVSGQLERSQNVNLIVSTVGDDQKAPAEISAAHLPNGVPVPLVSSDTLGPILLDKNSVYRAELALAHPIRVSMEVSAHEA